MCHMVVLFSAPRGFFRVLRFSPLLKNQHFQILILAWKVSPISAGALDTFNTQIKLIIIIIFVHIVFKREYFKLLVMLSNYIRQGGQETKERVK